MNIFVLDYNPEKCAEYHCDKHVVKMILETVQMICTNHRVANILTKDYKEIPYQATHVEHPCTVWARQSKQNYLWLCELLEALHMEWQYRYKEYNEDNYEETEHKSYVVFKQLNHEAYANSLPNIGLQPFAQAMPIEYRHPTDAVEAYRLYYVREKSDILKYTKRNKPKWLKDYE